MDAAACSEASKPEEGNATMVVAITEMVAPHAECTGRMPTGYSGTTKCVTLQHYGQKARKKAFMAFNRRLTFTSTEATHYFSIEPQLSV